MLLSFAGSFLKLSLVFHVDLFSVSCHFRYCDSFGKLVQGLWISVEIFEHSQLKFQGLQVCLSFVITSVTLFLSR